MSQVQCILVTIRMGVAISQHPDIIGQVSLTEGHLPTGVIASADVSLDT